MIIAFTGPALSGKNTAAEFFTRRGFQEYALAEPIKEALCRILEIDPMEIELLKDDPPEGFDKTLRYMMQTLGTDWGRDMIDKDLWIKLADRRLAKIKSARGAHFPLHTRLVIPDVRFDNEAEWVRGNGGRVIHLRRDKAPAAEITHVSDYGVTFDAARDISINNNGTVRQLERRLEVVTGITVAPQRATSDTGVTAVARDVIHTVSVKHGIASEELLGRSRRKEVMRARREAIGLLYVNTNCSLKQIARLVGLRDHGTVAYHLRELNLRRVEHPRLQN